MKPATLRSAPFSQPVTRRSWTRTEITPRAELGTETSECVGVFFFLLSFLFSAGCCECRGLASLLTCTSTVSYKCKHSMILHSSRIPTDRIASPYTCRHTHKVLACKRKGERRRCRYADISTSWRRLLEERRRLRRFSRVLLPVRTTWRNDCVLLLYYCVLLPQMKKYVWFFFVHYHSKLWTLLLSLQLSTLHRYWRHQSMIKVYAIIQQKVHFT